jgi:hypothetical protein
MLLTWLRGWWRRGQLAVSLGLAEYRTQRALRRLERAEGRLESLPPRALVLAAYRRVLRRAGALGWRRSVAQTPGEFADRLSRRGPAGDALLELTDAFQEARYSRHEITSTRAGRVLALWRLLRRRLRSRE